MTWFEEERARGILTLKQEFARTPMPSSPPAKGLCHISPPQSSKPRAPSNLSEIEEYMKRKRPGIPEVLRVAEMGRRLA